MTSAPFFFSLGGSQLSTAPVIAGMVGHWPLDEGTGTTANDLSSTNADGTIINGTWVAGPGPSGNALSLNGTTSFVNCGDFAAWDFGTAPFSACGWVKSGAGLNGRVFGQQTASTNPGWMWLLGNASVANDFAARVVSTPTTPHSVGTDWHHIATVRVGSSLKKYVDAVLIQDLTIGSVLSASGGSDLRIGAGSTDGTTIIGYVPATVYGFRLYASAMTLSDINYFYVHGI